MALVSPYMATTGGACPGIAALATTQALAVQNQLALQS